MKDKGEDLSSPVGAVAEVGPWPVNLLLVGACLSPKNIPYGYSLLPTKSKDEKAK